MRFFLYFLSVKGLYRPDLNSPCRRLRPAGQKQSSALGGTQRVPPVGKADPLVRWLAPPGEPCSLPGFAGSTVVPRSQPRNIFRARLAKSGRPNQKPYKIQRSFAGFCGAFSFCLENDGGKVRRAAHGHGRHGPTKAPQGLGNKHKRTRLPRRFLLQVRRFCQKACKMHGFVL